MKNSRVEVRANEIVKVCLLPVPRREFVNVTLDYRCDFKLYQRGRIDVR